MKFLADECCDTVLVEALRAKGHDVLFVMEDLRGAEDESILLRAFEENRILISEDKDFGELVFRLRLPAKGIVLLRFGAQDRQTKIPRMVDLVEREGQRLVGAFVVLEVDKTRIRPLRE